MHHHKCTVDVRTTPARKALGRAVREARARRGVSQEGLGELTGLHRNYVGAVERGEVNPTFGSLLRLTGGLGLPLSTLAAMYERQEREWRSGRWND